MIRATNGSRDACVLPLSIAPGGPLGARPAALVDLVRLVVEVRPGERPLAPDFGCRVHSLPRVESAAERQLAAALVEEALERWAPSLAIGGIEVIGGEPGRLWLRVASRAGTEEFDVMWHGEAETEDDR